MVEIALANGRGIALVDDADASCVRGLAWYLANGYAKADGPGHMKVYMHRLILGLLPGAGLEVDHRNRNRLDNRRANLRMASRSQQAANSKLRATNRFGFRGVALHPAWRRRKRWQAKIARRSLGYFKDPSAARAYDVAAKALFGEFATLNFPETA